MVVAEFQKVSYENYKKSMEAFNFSDEELLKMYEEINIPKRATKGSAGYDFFVPFDINLDVSEEILIPTGIRAKMNDGYVLMLFPRSGYGFKFRFQLNNTVGIIDSDYYYADNEGHIMCRMINDGRQGKKIEIKKGNAFVQGIFLPYFLAQEEEVEVVRTGGFGSTNQCE